ncbi:unnamed protein product, partial [Owenia fusiformis]
EFIQNLACADLLVTAIADPLCIIAVVKGEEFFMEVPVLCGVIAGMCLTACFAAFFSLTGLTVCRTAFILNRHSYNRYLNHTRSIIICIMFWVLGFIFESPNLIGWGRHTYDRKSHSCIWDRTANFAYTLFVAIGLIASPLVVMGACHIMVFKKIQSCKSTLYSKDGPGTTGSTGMLRVWIETVKSSKTLITIFCAFVICWVPYATVVAIDVEDKLPMVVHLFITFLAHLHSAINCYIYFGTNKSFRRNLYQLMSSFVCGCSRQEEDISSCSSGTGTATGTFKLTQSVSSDSAGYKTEPSVQGHM